MNRRSFLLSGAIVAEATSALRGQSASTTPPAASGTVDGSDIFKRYQLSRDRVIAGAQPRYTPQLLLEGLHGGGSRRFSEFRGDAAGRWISALSAASSVYGEHFAELPQLVSSIVPLQKPEGYFGDRFSSSDPEDGDMSLLWGNGRLLVGLMEYYSLTSDAASLQVARKIGNFLVGIAPTFNSGRMASRFGPDRYADSYICWTQCSEGLALLYLATTDDRYRQAVLEMSKYTQLRPGEHAHGYVTSLRGLTTLAAGSKDADLLSTVDDRWNEIATGHLLITGAVPELWAPKNWRTEGCATCDWLRLSLALYREKRDRKYLQAAHHVLFNDFAMNQFDNGDFGHVSLNRFHAPKRPETHAWWCCSLHGMRAFPDITQNVFVPENDGATFALPVSGAFSSGGLRMTSASKLGIDGTVTIRVQEANGHRLRVEQPDWVTAPLSVSRNSSEQHGDQVANLRTGDVLVVRYPMQIRELRENCGVTYFYGPWLLGATGNNNNGVPNELTLKNTIVSGSLHQANDVRPNNFAIPLARLTGTFSDEEFPQEPDVIHLQPVAEQTGMPSAMWQVHWSGGLQCTRQEEGASGDIKHTVKLAGCGMAAAAGCIGLGWFLGRRQKVQNVQGQA